MADALSERLQPHAEVLGVRVATPSSGGARFAIERRGDRAPELAARGRQPLLQGRDRELHDFEEIVGESAPLRHGADAAGSGRADELEVLLLGPSGSGKELFARAMHERSRRNARALVQVDCAALPPTLVESELFGREKGAFTGAVGAARTVRAGRRRHDLLDEIGDLSLDIQVKFLRVLQEGEFERVGSSPDQAS